MSPLRVHIPTDSHSTGRGIGFYTSNLIDALKKIKDIKLVDTQPDLIHYPYFDLFYPTLNPPKNIPSIVTIHDVTPLVLSRFYPKGIKGRFNLFKQKQALKRVTAVITDSNNSRQDIIKHLRVPENKIHVTPLAVDPFYSKPVSSKAISEVKAKYSLPDVFLLYVGGVNPNKNLPRLITAATKLNLPLVLVGSEFTRPTPPISSLKAKLGLQSVHPELKDLRFIKHSLETNPLLHALGFVSNQDLSAIYRLALAYCQPSLYEGFGLPVLEAMSAGCLIVGSNQSSLPEIYPPQAITFDPKSTQSMLNALKKVIGLKPKDRETLIKLGLERSKDFSWDATARLTATVYSLAKNT